MAGSESYCLWEKINCILRRNKNKRLSENHFRIFLINNSEGDNCQASPCIWFAIVVSFIMGGGNHKVHIGLPSHMPSDAHGSGIHGIEVAEELAALIQQSVPLDQRAAREAGRHLQHPGLGARLAQVWVH